MGLWSIFGGRKGPSQEATPAEKLPQPSAEQPNVVVPTEASIQEPRNDIIAQAQSAARYKGRVRNFNERGYGFITVDSPNGQPDVFVHISAVQQRTCLFKDEPVEFELIQDNDGKTKAVKVLAINPRFRGRVKKWLIDKRYGFIKQNDSDIELFVHYGEILAGGQRELIEGEEVEFFAVRKEDGKFQASSVKVFQSRFLLEQYADIERFNNGELLDELKEMAQYEDWDYKNTKAGKQYPVLWSYIIYTFARLIEENKIATAKNQDGKDVACGNTGLVTDLQEEIFAYFVEKKHSAQEWQLTAFLKKSDRKLTCFETLPDIANYFGDRCDLLYNTKRELRTVVNHIIDDNIHRFPEHLRANKYALGRILEGSVEAAIQRVRRNYKTAIPQFFQGNLQLLLPLCLSSPSQADLALVVSLDGEVYIASTVLPLDMAYNNARLIARPDREWLEPIESSWSHKRLDN